MKVPFYRHNLNQSCYKDALSHVLENEFLTTGPICNQVAQRIKQFFDCSSSIMTSSWTSGAQALLRYLKNHYYRDQEISVLTSSLTFCATANAAVNEGYNVQLLDVNRDTLHITYESVIRAIEQNPSIKIVIYVHLYGYFEDLTILYEYLKGKGILLIEDCAHCFEAKSSTGVRPGQKSDAAIFSFYATKNITCGEGGAIISNRFDLPGCLSPYLLHGMTKGAFDRHKTSNVNVYDVEEVGIKANMSDINAALLSSQISQINTTILNRTNISSLYRHYFRSSNIKIASLEMDADGIHANHLFPILVDPDIRDTLREHLKDKNIGTAINFPSLFDLSFYKNHAKYLDKMPESVVLGRQLLSLPFFETMTEQQIQYVASSVIDFVK